MARVHLLDDELINKIAAGEVVERPASVVKELVENAIDAGAKQIKVQLRDGGRQLIQVQDDGVGMDPVDAALAVKRHTTSKLQVADDLFQVTTMGFRGEALASIASVCRFTLQTQTASSGGLRIQISEDQSVATAWQGSPGTTLTIADLFYNVPARKAFLKSASAEFAACHEYMQALALSLPQLGFTLLHNDKEIFSVSPLPIASAWPRGEIPLRQRALALLGEADAGRLLYLHCVDRHLRLEGLVSAPGHDKGSARHCYTFVNGRWVRDKLLRFALQRGYHSHLLKGKFPIALLYLEVDPSLVDVNVHPAKTELRFQYGQEIQNAVVHGIRGILRDGDWAAGTPVGQDSKAVLQPTLEPSAAKTPPAQALPANFDLILPQIAALESEVSSRPPFTSPLPPLANPSSDLNVPVSSRSGEDYEGRRLSLSQAKSSHDPFLPRAAASPTKADDKVRRTTWSFDPLTAPIMRPEPAPESPGKAKFQPALVFDGASAAVVSPAIPWADLQFIGAFSRCFLLFEYQDQMLAIDQHAFHERILYERLQKDQNLLRVTQPLLMPEVLVFSPVECESLCQLQDSLLALGIHLHGVSATEVEVSAVPSLMINKDIQGLLASILAGKDRHDEFTHDVLATMACHAAVRAGEDLPLPELQILLQEAKTVDFYHNCPHGRRVFRWWKLAQVAAWFDR